MSSRASPYRERQTRDWCCMHALNNAVGSAAFTPGELEAVSGAPGSWGDREIEGVLRDHAEYQGVSFARADPRRRSLFDLFLTFDSFLGYVVKCDSAHWVALRRDPAPSSSFEKVDSVGRENTATMPRYDAGAAWAFLDGLRGNHHAIFRRGGVNVARLLAEDARRARRQPPTSDEGAGRSSKRLRREVNLVES